MIPALKLGAEENAAPPEIVQPFVAIVAAPGTLTPPLKVTVLATDCVDAVVRSSLFAAVVATDAIDAAKVVLRDPTALVLAATVDEVPFVASLMHVPVMESMVAPPVTVAPPAKDEPPVTDKPEPELGPITVRAVPLGDDCFASMVVPVDVEIVTYGDTVEIYPL